MPVAILFLSACSSFRPRGDYAEEKETGVRTMVAPIFAFRNPHGQAESAAQAECALEKKSYKYERASGVRNNIIQYRCLSRAPSEGPGQIN